MQNNGLHKRFLGSVSLPGGTPLEQPLLSGRHALSAHEDDHTGDLGFEGPGEHNIKDVLHSIALAAV